MGLKDLLKPNFDKEGKGVEPDEPPKPGYVRIWQIFFRNFNRMLYYGLIMAVVALPLILAAFAYVSLNDKELLDELQHVMEQRELDPNFDGTVQIANVWVAFLLPFLLNISKNVYIPVLAVCAVLFGPLTCGLTFCVRNHTREEHVWFADLFVRAWRNKWQGLFFGLLDVLITYSLIMYMFSMAPAEGGGGILFVLQVLITAVFVIYMIMRIYIYQMIVTFSLKIRGLLKNAWMFVVLGFKRNLLAALATLAFFLVFYGMPVLFPALMPLFMVIIVMLSCSLIPYSQTFITYPVMHKYLVEPALKEQEAKRKKMGKREE